MTTRPPRTARESLLLVGSALALQAIVWAVLTALFTAHIGYGLHDLSDTPHYLWAVERLWSGAWPYIDFPFEYPPLSFLFFLAPMKDGTWATYATWFTAEMIGVCMASAAVVTLTAMRIWAGLARPLGVAGAFALAVALAGGISVNRFDPAVGLVIALSILAMTYGRTLLAAAAIGLGFAIKLVPIVLLPLALILAPPRRKVAAVVVALAAAVSPFLPFLMRSGGAFNAAIAGQSDRGLQLESVAATPYLLWGALQRGTVDVVVPPGGSLAVEAPGTQVTAQLLPAAVLVLLVVAYAAVWHARRLMRTDAEWISPAALSALLAFMCADKVLSPQHLLWVLPLIALCLLCNHRAFRLAAVLLLAAVALTQLEFPAFYYRLQDLETLPVVVVAVRNLLLALALAILVVTMWRAGARTVEGV
jgi:hypothetical protein